MKRRSFLGLSFGAIVGYAFAPIRKLATAISRSRETDLTFAELESVLLHHVNPLIAAQFEQSHTLYSRFASGVTPSSAPIRATDWV